MLTILMPCLNEETNIGFCVDQAMAYLNEKELTGEVLIVDNGSTDRSAGIAAEHGARVITEERRGYGFAERKGLAAAAGKVIILGDSDSTYDFRHLDPFYMPLIREEADLVIGNRFAGMMEKGAMPVFNQLGSSFLSWCGRRRFKTAVHDFHCGIRGIRKDALQKCSFHTTGMEFATEMIAEAVRKGLRIREIPVPYKVSKQERQVKLRPLRDGLRHIWYIISA